MKELLIFIQNNLLYIGGIFIAPALFRLAFMLTHIIALQLKKESYIKHYHKGKLISQTTIYANSDQPIKTIYFPEKND